jgi:hypothetical protein
MKSWSNFILSESSTCWARRSATEDEALRLGEGYVTAVSQWRDAEAAAVADVLVVVADLCIADVHLCQATDITVHHTATSLI